MRILLLTYVFLAMASLAFAQTYPVTGKETFDFLVADGRVPGHTVEHKFGSNADVDAAAAEDVWDGGGTYAFPTAARVHKFVSSDTSDTHPNGTGARTVAVYGLDSDTLLAQETINLSGADTATTTTEFISIYRVSVTSSGSSQANEGTLLCIADVDETTSAQVTIGKGQTQMAIYMVPADRDFYLYNGHADLLSGTAATTGQVEFKVMTPGTNTWRVVGIRAISDYTVADPLYTPPLKVPAGTKMKITGDVDKDNAYISAGWDGIFKLK